MTLHKAANVNVQNKVVLTQAQKEIIDKLLSEYSKENIVKWTATQDFNGTHAVYQIPYETLIIALYRPEDITIEQTVEEQLLELFNDCDETDGMGYGMKLGIERSLDIIGMKVKGINA